MRDIDIYYYGSDGSVGTRYTAPVTEGALVHYELMNSHYVKLSFDTAKPIGLQIGDFINTQWGRFEITSKYNPTYDGFKYTYEPEFEAYYRKWKNKILRYIPTTGAEEASFSLTASISVHARLILRNLAYLGSKDKSYYFNPDYTPPTTLTDNFASSVVYSNTDFTVVFDSTIDTSKAKLVSYQNANILDSLTSIADTFECEWWITENTIHFGTCKLEQTSNVELKIGTNVDTISASQSQADYATRLLSFGAEKNLPDDYKKDDSEDITKDGVVQRRLMLPTKEELEAYSQTSDSAKAVVDNINALLEENGFELSGNTLQIKGISEQQAIENVLVNEDDYPKNIIKIGKVTSYESTVENTETAEEGDTITRTYYRVSDLTIVDEDGNKTGDCLFLSDYIQSEKTLHILFQSGTMNGMDFECHFNPDGVQEYKTDSNGNFIDSSGNITTDKSKRVINPDAQVFEITANEDYGRFLPDTILHPKEGDTFVLYNWDATKMSDNLVINASIDLLLDTIEYLKKSMIDPSTYTVTMLADTSGTFYSVGAEVRLYHNAYFQDGYRDSRIIGFEAHLDIPWDSLQYTIGEKPSYSKIGELSKQVSEITVNGTNYQGGVGGGSSIYVVKQSDTTPFSDTNVMSSLRAKKEFLSKTSPDTASGKITFADGLASNNVAELLKGLTVGDGKYGITEEGVATLAKVIANSLSQFLGGAQFGSFTSGIDNGTGGQIDQYGNGELESLTVRSFLRVMELLVNRYQAQEGDTIFSENDQIDSVEETTIDDVTYYTLTLKEKWEGYYTAQKYGNIIKGRINTLAAKEAGISDYSSTDTSYQGQDAGGNLYYTSWMRVVETVNYKDDALDTAIGELTNNQIRVVLYGDTDTPAQKNFPPCKMMVIVREGCIDYGDSTDTTLQEDIKRRQQVFYLSTTEGRIVKLTGVNKPILEEGNYGVSLGFIPDFIKQWDSWERLKEQHPHLTDRDYLYAQGLIYEDLVHVNVKGAPVPVLVECTDDWIDGSTATGTITDEYGDTVSLPAIKHGIYFNCGWNPKSNQFERHVVRHTNGRWMCLQNQPVVSGETKTYYEPKWNSPYWKLIDGDGTFVVEFVSSNGSSFRRGYVNTVITAMLFCGNVEITDDIAAEYFSWTRTLQTPTDESKARDTTWNAQHKGIKALTLTNDDMDVLWSSSNKMIFTCTVVINDGTTKTTVSNEVIA